MIKDYVVGTISYCFEECDDFEHEIWLSDIIEDISENYHIPETTVQTLIEDEVILAEDYFERYQEYLEEKFEDEAREEYQDYRSFKKNPYSYYGVDREDFC